MKHLENSKIYKSHLKPAAEIWNEFIWSFEFNHVAINNSTRIKFSIFIREIWIKLRRDFKQKIILDGCKYISIEIGMSDSIPIATIVFLTT